MFKQKQACHVYKHNKHFLGSVISLAAQQKRQPKPKNLNFLRSSFHTPRNIYSLAVQNHRQENQNLLDDYISAAPRKCWTPTQFQFGVIFSPKKNRSQFQTFSYETSEF